MIELELDVDGPGKLRRVTEQYYLWFKLVILEILEPVKPASCLTRDQKLVAYTPLCPIIYNSIEYTTIWCIQL